MAVRDREGGGSLFPGWKELLSGAADRLAREEKHPESELVHAHLKVDPPLLFEAARHAKRALGPSWFHFLTDRFDPPRSRAQPESLTLARAVWTLGSNLIVTTNYDRVLQWAAPETDDLRIWDIQAPAAQVRFLREGSKVPVVWHLHGQVERVERMILSPDGYRRLYGGKAAKPRHQTAIATLHSLLASRSFLFVGFSMADELFGMQLRHVSMTFRTTNGPHYALICASQVDGVKALNLPIEVVTFADFGQPLLDLIAEIADAATSAAGSRFPFPAGAVRSAYTPGPIFTVPFRSKGEHVVDREGALKELRRQLVSGRTTELGHTAALRGLGGLGKTQLAVEYAHRFRDAYPDGVFWINADQELDPQLLAFSDQAGWFSPGSDASYKLEVARQRVSSANRALLVLDNLEGLDSVALLLESPPPDRHLLVTTQYDFPEFSPVDLDPLNKHASLKLLLQEASYKPKSKKDWKAAREIAHAMAGLPLALELAGAYLCHRPIG
ncbi:MAG TPA: SIR2 family protein, partial [Longimicrobium sp.]|nr:SIR2 family protein [Longimicrobium sp.]